ncbi:MAG: DegT/DnrJ/EryC1/StrS family aminotransferase [Actinomycetota bacterium]|nr:DegT/DnrJ/EryC1/StrS family aminotransferase [Actinomycetota bacterium]
MTSRLPAVLGGSPAFPAGLPLVRPDLPDTAAIARRLQQVLDSGILTNGPSVRRLEEAVAEYVRVDHVVAVSSCTAGLMLVLQACGLSGRVVLPSFTFAASAHAVHWAGGCPSFADIEPLTLTLDPQDAARRLDGAESLFATHLYGTPCDVERLQELARGASVPLLFDAAHALGSRRRGRLVGGFGTAEVFSLSPTKVTVAGEGGLITTNDGALAEACRYGRDYGNPGDYDCLFPGLNARMSELHATVALASLADLDERVAHRTALARRVHDGLSSVCDIDFPKVSPGDTSTFKDLTVLVASERFGLSAVQLATALRGEGIDTRRYYHPPVHRQKAYVNLAQAEPLPVTDWAAERVLTLPLWSHMTSADIDRVVGAVARIGTHAERVHDALVG